MINKKQFTQEFEIRFLLAKAEVYSDLSLKRKLTNNESKAYKKIIMRLQGG